MYCYQLDKGKAIRGIPPSLLPNDGSFTKDIIENADVELIGNDGLTISLETLVGIPLHRLSTVCAMQLAPSNRSLVDRAIVVYRPTEVFLDRDGGDETDVVYRSPTVFAGIAHKGRTKMRFIKKEFGAVMFNDNGVYVSADTSVPLRRKTDSFVIRIS